MRVTSTGHMVRLLETFFAVALNVVGSVSITPHDGQASVVDDAARSTFSVVSENFQDWFSPGLVCPRDQFVPCSLHS